MPLRHILPAFVLLSFLLPSCKPSAKGMRHIQLDGYVFSEKTDSMQSEARTCVEHYLQTGDARYATPQHGITLLHLAAMTHRFWLVEQLLAEGADPNARMRQGEALEPGDTPAILAVRAGRRMSNDDALLIVKALRAAGADINLPGYHDRTILTHCSDASYRYETPLSNGEQLALELIDLGARGNTEAAGHFVSCAWPSALGKLLASAERDTICASMPELLHLSAFFFDGREEELACATLLLEHADDVDARHKNADTPLHTLAGHDKQEDEEETALRAAYILMLLEKGANPYLPGNNFGKSCAADSLQARPELLERLAQEGHHIPPPPHDFATETLVEQLTDIPVAAVSRTEARHQWDSIAPLLTSPTEAMLAKGIHYRCACVNALALLQKADAARAEALVAALPLWQDAAAWEGEAPATRALLFALQQNPLFSLPKEQLLSTARAMEAAGKPALAHAFARLLHRAPSSRELITQLCEDEQTPLPIRAAAWSSRVKLAGLPSLGEVDEWAHNKSTYRHDAVRLACRADEADAGITHPDAVSCPERLFFEGEPDSDPNEYAQRNLASIGAPLAAHLLKAAAPANLSAELAACKERYGLAVAASFELEIALARHILKHEAAFREVEAEAEKHAP